MPEFTLSVDERISSHFLLNVYFNFMINISSYFLNCFGTFVLILKRNVESRALSYWTLLTRKKGLPSEHGSV